MAETAQAGTDSASADGPLGFAQEMHQANSEANPGARLSAYFSARIEGELDLDALLAAIRELARRHDVLRLSTHIAEDGSVRQFARDLPQDTELVRCVELANASAEQFDRYARKNMFEMSLRTWRLDRELPVQFLLLRHTPTVHALLASFAPVAVDERSRRLVIRQLWEFYAEYREGGRPPSPADPIEFVETARQQRRKFERRSATTNARYWQDREHDLAGLDAGPDRRTAGPVPASCAKAAMHIDGGRLAALRGECDRRGFGVSHLVSGQFAAVVFDTLDRDWLIADFAVDMRNSQEKNVVGMFVLTIPVLVWRQHGLIEQIEHVRRELLRAVTHCHVAPADLAGFRQLAQRRCESEGVPRLAVSHAYIGGEFGRPDATGLTIDIGAYNPKLVYQARGADLRADEFSDGLGLEMIFNPSIFPAAVAQGTARRLAAALGVSAECLTT